MADPPPPPNDRMVTRNVQSMIDSLQDGRRVELHKRLDTNPGFKMMARKDQERMRALLQDNPTKYNFARITWDTRSIQAMVEDVRLAAASAAFVCAKVDEVKKEAMLREVRIEPERNLDSIPPITDPLSTTVIVPALLDATNLGFIPDYSMADIHGKSDGKGKVADLTS